MGTFGGPDIITNGLVFLTDAASARSYPGSGNTWYDLSGNNYDLTLTNGPVWNSAGYFVNDADSYFTGAGGSNLPQGNDSYTMVVWARQPSAAWGASSGLITIGGFGTTNGSNALRTNAGVLGQLRHYWWGNDLALQNNAAGIIAGDWFQAAASFDGTTRRIWVNGVSRASDTPTGHNVTSTAIQVSRAYTSEYQEGDMAVACIYDRALSSAEMLQNYNALKNRFL